MLVWQTIAYLIDEASMSYNRGRGFGFGGFSFNKKQETTPPPPNATLSKHGYHTMTAISQNAISGGCGYGQPRKRPRDEDEYFDDEDESFDGAYQPAPGSPGPQRKEESDSDEDPLDAFMAGIEQEVKRTKTKGATEKKEMKGVRDDIDEEDDEESYYRYIQENPNAGRQQEDSEDEIEYDEDGNPIAPKKPKYIDPLPPIDHSTIEYQDFTKNFYQEHEDIAALTPVQANDLRVKLGIKVTGFDAPKLVTSFGHFGFDEALMKAIRKSEYTQPTPIQSQAVPIALSGRDAIGIAKTGSGKTAAFIWPMLVHIMDQKELAPDDGPIGLILAPTRELAQQIYTEARRFGKVYNIQVVCAYGGGSKWEQSKALEAGAEIVVATPGRMIDMIKMKATNLRRVTFLVLDEADRMFDMGFEPQVRSICDHVRPDRQTLLFSATFKRKVERLARDVLTDPVRVVQGELGEANQDVTQIVKIMNTGGHKWNWLNKRLVEFMSAGSVLIFVTKKANAEELSKNLVTKEFEALLLHGDMTQFERNDVITSFKKKDKPILVATDVAARGLDIPHIKTVINFDVARDIDTHTHRIGRTGRAGEKGTAYTLVTDKDKEFAGHLVRNLEGAAQEVPSELLELAMQSTWFRKSRFKQSKAKALGGRGLGFRERPGLGSTPNNESSGGGGGGSGSGVVNVGPAGQAYGGGDPSTTGPATNRLAAMKAAFQSQYKNQFTAASAETAWHMDSKTQNNPQRERKRKSRWDD
ncbi:ATP-dependent RNA helicase DDX42-like isoform X1 [Penaeus chinensis]|uniref:ATP-dependent RNA helicase DDX42-like isoform X1 n=2 Tax=Penaeus chinensis TaxID=139456 RepID=UPI001FB84879|nr:ATP-dependent RNA helicase DDX42-like isoform X1 [Penaeus chinensis]